LFWQVWHILVHAGLICFDFETGATAVKYFCVAFSDVEKQVTSSCQR